MDTLIASAFQILISKDQRLWIVSRYMNLEEPPNRCSQHPLSFLHQSKVSQRRGIGCSFPYDRSTLSDSAISNSHFLSSCTVASIIPIIFSGLEVASRLQQFHHLKELVELRSVVNMYFHYAHSGTRQLISQILFLSLLRQESCDLRINNGGR